MNRRFPLYVDLTGKRVLVIGGGTIAARRCRVLSDFGPKLTVIAPEIRPEILALPGIDHRLARFSESELPEAELMLACTDDRAVNAAVVEAARRRGIPVNDCSDPAACDFHFPAIALRGPLVVGVNAGGQDHRLVARSASEIRKLLDRW